MNSAERAGAREWAGLAVLTLPVLLVSMDMSVLHLALPEITAELRPSATQALWAVDIYAFMVAGLLITMGAVGDRIGRRRLLLIGAAAFAAASVAAATATSAEVLIAARAALGVAGALDDELAGVPAPLARTAEDTLAGALSVRGDLPAPIVTSAIEAFTGGLHVAAGVSVVAVVLVGVIAVAVLRRTPGQSASTSEIGVSRPAGPAPQSAG